MSDPKQMQAQMSQIKDRLAAVGHYNPEHPVVQTLKLEQSRISAALGSSQPQQMSG